MIKKTIYFCLIFLLYLILGARNIKAIETCYFFVNNEFHSSVDLPFYYHELTRETILDTSLPYYTYAKNTIHIDSLTKCNSIKKTILNPKIIHSKLEFAHYTKTNTFSNEEEFFWDSIFKVDNSLLIGQGKQFDTEPPKIYEVQPQYTSNIDYPIELSMLLNTFSAYDTFDGNISSNIKIEYDEYSSNTNKIGEYLVIISVEDSSKNKISSYFYIKVVDTTPPIIEGKNEYISYLSSPLNIALIKENLLALDNTNIDLTSQIFICEDTYSSNKNVVGKHNLYFCVYDYSNNISDNFLVEIDVKDDIPPVIEGLDYFSSYLSSPLSIQDILYSIAASDNNKDVSSSIFITRDLYSNFQNTTGEKYIYVQAMDEYLNVSKEFKVTINLIDDIPPQIFGLNTYDSYLSSPLSISHIKQQLTVLDNINGNITSNLEIINDSYSNNINKKGTYFVTFIVKDTSNNISENFKATINNIDNVKPYFTGPELLTYQINQKPSLEYILNQYIAIDNNDSYIKFEVTNDTYSDSIKTGDFFISLSCVDSSLNESIPFSIKITIVEEISKTKSISLYLPTSYMLTESEISSLISINKPYTIIEDTYSNNYESDGTYKIKYKLQNEDILELNITTFNVSINEVELTKKEDTKKETFITMIKRFFNKIFDFFKNLFNCIILKDYRFFL